MSLFRGAMPPPPIPDEAIERYLALVGAEIDPDPLFRRRLRGHVLNRFVAARDGTASRGWAAKEMGRLGRAVLHVSFALALSVSGAMAASQQAIPGDALYPLKLQVEQIRFRSVPDALRDDVAASMLRRRIEELGRLAETENWAAVASHAAAVEAAYDAVVGLTGDPGALAGHLEVASELLERLPEGRAAVDRATGDRPDPGLRGGSGGAPAWPGHRPSGPDTEGPPDRAADPGSSGDGDEPSQGRGRSGSDGTDTARRREPRATKGPKPMATPEPMATQESVVNPEPTASPERSTRPEAAP